MNASDYQNYTFGSLINKLNLPRDPGRLPLISTIITHETATAGLTFADLNVEVVGNPKSFCNFDLELYLMESDAGLAVNFRYNTDLFDDDTVRRWAGHYHTLLEGSRGRSRPAHLRAALADGGGTASTVGGMERHGRCLSA